MAVCGLRTLLLVVCILELVCKSFILWNIFGCSNFYMECYIIFSSANQFRVFVTIWFEGSALLMSYYKYVFFLCFCAATWAIIENFLL